MFHFLQCVCVCGPLPCNYANAFADYGAQNQTHIYTHVRVCVCVCVCVFVCVCVSSTGGSRPGELLCVFFEWH